MNRFLLINLLLSVFVLPSAAQNLRTVRGLVRGEDKQPLAGVRLVPADGSEGGFSSNDGTFEIRIGYDVASLTAVGEDLISVTMPIDGSYLIFNMKTDIQRIQAREDSIKTERLAQERAEQAREKAVRDSLHSIELEKQAVLAELKRQQLAREKAIRDSIRSEEHARQAKLDQEKRQEKQRIAEERRQARNKAYAERFGAGDKGFGHDISISYTQSIGQNERVIYKHSGMREYANLIPISLTYTFSYKVHRTFSAGVGLGVLYNVQSITIAGDEFASRYGGFSEKQLSVPVFADLKFRPFKSAVRPVFEVKGGWYFMSNVWLVNASLGVEYRFSPTASVNLSVGFRDYPWPTFRFEDGFAKYQAAWMPFVSIGIGL